MNLRELKPQDASFMLEWMHDTSVIRYMRKDFASKTLEDCKRFILAAQKDSDCLHRAIADEEGRYMGTVSLKHIDTVNHCAEFAIIVRKEAMGRGYSRFGMREIIRYGFEELELQRIYWCVSRQNERAIHFYDKNGYERMEALPEKEHIYPIGYSEGQMTSFYWYLIQRE